MHILSVCVRDVRQFSGQTAGLSGLSDNLCVWAARNETGKTTFVDALIAVFLRDRKSKAADIQSLVPHAGGAPEITVEFVHKGAAWTLFKRFLRNAVAEVRDAAGIVVAQGDAAEAWLAQEFPHAALAVDLLWARQGALAMEPEGSGSVEKRLREEGREARRGLMSAAAAALDAGLGGVRFDAVRARLTESLAELRTATGLPKKSGALAKAIVRRETAHAALLAAQSIKARADTAVAARARARGAESLAVARFEQALLAVDMARSDVMRLRQEADAARRSYAPLLGAAAALEEARFARDTALATQRKRQKAQADRDVASLELERLDTIHGDADVLLEEAVVEKAAAEAALAAADAVLAHATSALQSAQVGALDAELAAWKAVPVPVATAHDCAQWEADLARFTALDATHEGIIAEAVWEGIDPPAGWTSEIARTLRDGDAIVVGRGRLVIRAPGATERLERRSALQARLVARVEETGFSNPDQLRSALAKAQEAALRIRALESDRLQRFSGVEASAADVCESRAVYEAARQGQEKVRRDLVEVNAKVEQNRVAQVQHERARLAAQGVLNTAQAVLDTLPEAVVDLDAIEVLYTQAQDRAAQARAAERLVQDRESGLIQAEGVFEDAQRALDHARPERDLARERRADADGVARMAAEGDPESALRAAQEEADVADADVRGWEQEADALGMAIQALDAARAACNLDLFEPACVHMEPMVQALFGQAVTRFGGDSLLPDGLSRAGVSEDLGVLSGGTHDLLQILGRLSFAKVLRDRGVIWPVLLDDSFAQIDEGRIAALGLLLNDQVDGQILALSGRETTLSCWSAKKVSVVVRP